MQQEDVLELEDTIGEDNGSDEAARMAAHIVTEDWLVRAPVFYIQVRKANVLFTKSGVTLDAETALQSGELVTNLMKLGVFSSNLMAAMSGQNGSLEVEPDLVPAFMIGMAGNFATCVAARRIETDAGWAICLERLAADIERIEAQYGIIPVDHALCMDIAALAIAIKDQTIDIGQIMGADDFLGGDA